MAVPPGVPLRHVDAVLYSPVQAGARQRQVWRGARPWRGARLGTGMQLTGGSFLITSNGASTRREPIPGSVEGSADGAKATALS